MYDYIKYYEEEKRLRDAYYAEQKRINNETFPTQRDVYIVVFLCVAFVWLSAIFFYISLKY
ncbi:MAG: hypothetical protein J6M62_11090 [Selenomonadaceae bacterium]|nr:hypothetical protein [Selenomonadaceae bacterium]MBP3723328.1 hypothetical protein [Selenomonadaceae bacterium]